jgi:hypothetical protein
MNKYIDFAKRNSVLIIICAMALLLMKPGIAEVRTLLLIASIETLAIALSGVSAYVYTRIEFTRQIVNSNLGFIFLGVHICVGLVVLGVYLAQFGG